MKEINFVLVYNVIIGVYQDEHASKKLIKSAIKEL